MAVLASVIVSYAFVAPLSPKASRVAGGVAEQSRQTAKKMAQLRVYGRLSAAADPSKVQACPIVSVRPAVAAGPCTITLLVRYVTKL